MWVGYLKFLQVTEYMNVVQLGLGGKIHAEFHIHQLRSQPEWWLA